MTPDTIRLAESRIRERIDEVYVDPSGKAAPIYDGVIDAKRYCGSDPRIMWILKEPWDDVDSSGGGWSLCSDLLAQKPVSSLSQSTFHPIIYIAYGLFHGVRSYDMMPWVRDMNDAEDILRRLAYINAKKLPGVTRGAYAPTIMEWYSRGRDVLHDQIAAYSPDIVFGCSPHMPAILDDLAAGWQERKQTAGSSDCVWQDDVLFVHVYHPGQTSISRARYVDDALSAVALAMQDEQSRTRRWTQRLPAVTSAACAPVAPSGSRESP